MWDGSFVKIEIKERREMNDTLYWRINFSDIKELNKEKGEWAIVKKTTNNFYTIVDNLRPNFGLEKIGTHITSMGKNKFLLMKAKIRNNSLTEDKIFHIENVKKEKRELRIKEMQKLILFHYVFNLPFPRKVIVRKGRLISIGINNHTHLTQGRFFNPTVYEKWFPNTTPTEVLNEMLSIRENDNYLAKLFDVRDKVGKIDMKMSFIFFSQAEKRCMKNT